MGAASLKQDEIFDRNYVLRKTILTKSEKLDEYLWGNLKQTFG